jgi:hypothetical protein
MSTQRKGRSSKNLTLLGGVSVIAVGASGLLSGGFGAFSSFANATQQVNTLNATLNRTDVTVTGDAGGTALTESVVDMIPGDYRERLVRLSAPTGQTLSTLQYQVQGAFAVADPTTATLGGINQVGDAVDALAATNSSATAGQPGGNAAAGQGGLAIEIYTCSGTWTRANGIVTSRTDDVDYSCSAGGNGTIAGSFTDVPTSGYSTAFTIAASLTDTGTEFMIRTRFVDDGTTNGRQNVMQNESINLTHRFTASTRAAGAV